MVLETQPPEFAAWIWPALLYFAEAAAVLGLLAFVIALVFAVLRHGPMGAGDAMFHTLKTGFLDMVSISPRRVMALTWLSVQESLRRRVLVGFGLFVLILLFAGWFLDSRSSDPARLYISFVLTATTYLVLLMALFLSVFSLPADIKSKTIYTIVTKPVRPGEIVLGRILGFSLIGTLMLLIMGVISYFFVVRLLNHTHEVDIASLETAAVSSSGDRNGRTTLDQNHRHRITIGEDGEGETDVVNGHWHTIDEIKDGDEVRYAVGPPRGMLLARVPHYGELRFKDRSGESVSRGISVGKEWKYFSFIEGGTLAAATWTFNDVTPERFPDGLPVEMQIRVFRSHKGNIEQGIRGSLVLRNPRNTAVESELFLFTAKDFTIDELTVPRTLRDSNGETIDLFKDLAPDGEVEIELQCLEDGQYFGAAKAALYLRVRNASFAGNFIKGFLGIWVRMLLVTAFGVMFSTFLSGPVAALATLAVVIMGWKIDFIFGVAEGTIEGGGPIESLIRTIKQLNVTTKFEPGLTTDIIKAVDGAFMTIMTSVASLAPNFNQFDNVTYVEEGFNVPPDLVLVQIATGLGYVVAVFAIGYFALRMREVAR